MINKEEISAIKAELSSLKKKSSEIDNQYRMKSQELLEKVLSCKEVLNETKWKLQGDRALVSTNTKHKMISELLQNDYHCNFSTDELTLCFDDWDISIFFNTPEGLMRFIEKIGIALDVSNLKNRLKMDRENLKKLEAEIEKIENLNKLAATH